MGSYYKLETILDNNGKNSFTIQKHKYSKKMAFIKNIENLVKNDNKVWLSIMTNEKVIYNEINENAIFLLKHLDFDLISFIEYEEGESMTLINIYI